MLAVDETDSAREKKKRTVAAALQALIGQNATARLFGNEEMK